MGEPFLFIFTRLVNFGVLALALWLGFYIVTRSPRRFVTWLTGLTLWSVAAICLNVLITLSATGADILPLNWLRLILPAWQATGLERVAYAWLQGWSVMPMIALWHHVTVLMRPGPLSTWRTLRVVGGYGLAGAVLLLQAFTPLFFAVFSGNALFINPLRASPVYFTFIFFLLLYTGWSIYNLRRSAQAAPTAMPRRQLNLLLIATLIAGLTGPLLLIGSILNLPVPVVALSLSLGGAVLLIGYGVAGYSALVEGRTIRRDFAYSAFAIGLISIIYLLVMNYLVKGYGAPEILLVITLVLTITSHSLLDALNRHLDTHVYEETTRQVQAQLRQLTRDGRESTQLPEIISPAFATLCNSIRATIGLLFLFENDQARLVSAYRWAGIDPNFSTVDLTADDVCLLSPGHFAPPLEEAALLIPLYAEVQLGAILLGRPVNGLTYARTEVESILELSDRIADAIRDTRRMADRLQRAAQLAEVVTKSDSRQPDEPKITPNRVENVLRNLFDYAYLGEHALANVNLVNHRLSDEAVTHLERGKILHNLMVEVIEMLRPNRDLPTNPPTREWYPYFILHDAYLKDVPNRDIMARLYISEGTFNRTRRQALRAVARSLEEMANSLQSEN
jgi:hypothetical protein